MKIIQHLVQAIRSCAVYNPEVQAAPACILWPDKDSQWETVISGLQQELPELLILGDYAPEKRTGPGIWLRCVLAGRINDVALPEHCTPVIYLPGVSRHDIRIVDSCPDRLKPLVELQYRGVIWSQGNGRDWTIFAFLKSEQSGLGLDTAQDNETKTAMQLALYRLLDQEVELLKNKRLDRDYFNTLLSGGDPVRDLLQWLDQGSEFQNCRRESEWMAFVEVCKSQFAFNPQNEGVLTGAARLAAHQGTWNSVWERFCEAPKRYPNIPLQIRKCKAPHFDLFADAQTAGGWPQWNEEQEKALQRDLLCLSQSTQHEARKKLLELEKQHASRRSLVWLELGESPLANALKSLAILAETTKSGLAAGTVDDLAAGYQSQGWLADDAVIRALSVINREQDFEAVASAVRAVYMPWAEESARHLQKIVCESGYPAGRVASVRHRPYDDGECILFIDGLRFDMAMRLADLLRSSEYKITQRLAWAALPSVTATGKASVMPVMDKLRGDDDNTDFEPSVADTGKSVKGSYHIKKLLTNSGWTILERLEKGDGHGKAWCEFGNIDHEGHERGWKLAGNMEALLKEIHERITALLEADWKSVRVVTDHGWLLMPGGLPKIELSGALVETRWGRCAAIKPGASTKERLYPWFWNPNLYFALADGISCFRKGHEYAHGGLSLQECLTLELMVSIGKDGGAVDSVEITDIAWKGLRCTVAVYGNFSGSSLDIRTQPGNPSSSIIVSPKPFKDNGTASVVVEDEELDGREASVVVVNKNGSLVAQKTTLTGRG